MQKTFSQGTRVVVTQDVEGVKKGTLGIVKFGKPKQKEDYGWLVDVEVDGLPGETKLIPVFDLLVSGVQCSHRIFIK